MDSGDIVEWLTSSTWNRSCVRKYNGASIYRRFLLSASSEMCVACMVATKTLDNAHGNVSGARILDNAAATRSSSSHPVYPTTSAIERFASPKTEQVEEIT